MKRIKVLFLHDKLVCGGAEQALYDLVCLLDKGKFEITILVIHEGGEWEAKFRDAGIRVESIWSCQRKSKNPLVKFENWKKRKKIVESIDNDYIGIIDACFDSPFDIVVVYQIGIDKGIAITKNAKTVKYIHNDPGTNSDYRKGLLETLETIKKYDKIICVSNNAKKEFENVTGRSENVVAHFNPLNTRNIRELSSKNCRIEENSICAVGRLTYEKGFERLIRIHKRIYDKGYKYKLIIVGEGPMRELLENIIRSIHCEDSVELIGYQENPYPYMKNSRFIVCPSYSEGLSMIAMEALALGIPVVSAVPSISELFGEEICGVVTNNDDESLEAGIRCMLSDADFYRKAKSGAEKRSKYFDEKRLIKEIEQEFIELVNS